MVVEKGVKNDPKVYFLSNHFNSTGIRVHCIPTVQYGIIVVLTAVELIVL